MQWAELVESVRPARGKLLDAQEPEFARFTEYVKQMSEDARIPALLDAYDKYKSISLTCGAPSNDPEKHFESSCYSILISTILKSRIRPSASQATAILRRSFHRCGHGSDVEPPLKLAEAAFRHRAYTKELFDAVLAYKETLRPLRGTQASDLKRKLGWVLWHDSRYKGKRCYTRQIQRDIHSMTKAEAFKWQWLLRNTSAKMGAKPGAGWLKDAKTRLAPIGVERFHQKLDQWLTVPDEEAPLSAPGSCVLRLLIWCAMLDADRNLTVVARLSHVRWKDDAVKKVAAALAWAIGTYGGDGYRAEKEKICARWGSDVAQVQRLQEAHFPNWAVLRRQAEEEKRAIKNEEWEKRIEILRRRVKEEFAQQRGSRGTLTSA